MYMIRQGFDASLARPLAAALLALSASAIAVPAVAGPMPSPGAEATASARSVGNDAGTNVSQGAVNALIRNSVSEPDEAFARARATVGGAVGSESRTDATSGDGSTEAGSTATWVAQFATGGANPGSSVDIDFGLTVDGSLQVGNNNSGAGLNDVFAAVGVSLRAIGASVTTSIDRSGTGVPEPPSLATLTCARAVSSDAKAGSSRDPSPPQGSRDRRRRRGRVPGRPPRCWRRCGERSCTPLRLRAFLNGRIVARPVARNPMANPSRCALAGAPQDEVWV